MKFYANVLLVVLLAINLIESAHIEALHGPDHVKRNEWRRRTESKSVEFEVLKKHPEDSHSIFRNMMDIPLDQGISYSFISEMQVNASCLDRPIIWIGGRREKCGVRCIKLQNSLALQLFCKPFSGSFKQNNNSIEIPQNQIVHMGFSIQKIDKKIQTKLIVKISNDKILSSILIYPCSKGSFIKRAKMHWIKSDDAEIISFLNGDKEMEEYLSSMESLSSSEIQRRLLDDETNSQARPVGRRPQQGTETNGQEGGRSNQRPRQNNTGGQSNQQGSRPSRRPQQEDSEASGQEGGRSNQRPRQNNTNGQSNNQGGRPSRRPQQEGSEANGQEGGRSNQRPRQNNTGGQSNNQGSGPSRRPQQEGSDVNGQEGGRSNQRPRQNNTNGQSNNQGSRPSRRPQQEGSEASGQEGGRSNQRPRQNNTGGQSNNQGSGPSRRPQQEGSEASGQEGGRSNQRPRQNNTGGQSNNQGSGPSRRPQQEGSDVNGQEGGRSNRRPPQNNTGGQSNNQGSRPSRRPQQEGSEASGQEGGRSNQRPRQNNTGGQSNNQGSRPSRRPQQEGSEANGQEGGRSNQRHPQNNTSGQSNNQGGRPSRRPQQEGSGQEGGNSNRRPSQNNTGGQSNNQGSRPSWRPQQEGSDVSGQEGGRSNRRPPQNNTGGQSSGANSNRRRPTRENRPSEYNGTQGESIEDSSAIRIGNNKEVNNYGKEKSSSYLFEITTLILGIIVVAGVITILAVKYKWCCFKNTHLLSHLPGELPRADVVALDELRTEVACRNCGQSDPQFPNVILSPCGHSGICVNCVKTLQVCPIDKVPITGYSNPKYNMNLSRVQSEIPSY